MTDDRIPWGELLAIIQRMSATVAIKMNVDQAELEELGLPAGHPEGTGWRFRVPHSRRSRQLYPGPCFPRGLPHAPSG